MQESHIFKWAEKKSGRQPTTKFSGFVGDTKANIITILKGSDDGILTGEGGKKIFYPPYLPPRGSGNAEIFTANGDI